MTTAWGHDSPDACGPGFARYLRTHKNAVGSLCSALLDAAKLSRIVGKCLPFILLCQMGIAGNSALANLSESPVREHLSAQSSEELCRNPCLLSAWNKSSERISRHATTPMPKRLPDVFPRHPGRTTWVGAATIGSNFAKVVQEQGVCWTVDQLLTDVDRCAAILEWTRFSRCREKLVRGVD